MANVNRNEYERGYRKGFDDGYTSGYEEALIFNYQDSDSKESQVFEGS